jgi:hypothetical protein
MLKMKEKSGSAILLALMIMSAILSSVLYINILSIRSMKQAQNIDNSIVAFYGAEMGNEQAIYYIRKVEDVDINDLNLPGGSIVAGKNLVSRKINDSVQNVLVGLKKDETYQLDLFDQGDISVNSSIDRLSLTWDNAGLAGVCDSSPDIELTVNEWEAAANIDWGQMQEQMHISKCLLDSSPIEIDDSASVCSDIMLDGSKSYQFRFKALCSDIYNLTIKAFDSSNKQLSFKNIYSIESVGEYPVHTKESNKQALRVNLRKFSPLSGLFDYVLFSEKSLVKDTGAYTGGWFSEDLFISTDSLPDARLNIPYSYAMRAVNGTLPYVWSMSAFPGLEINETTGVLSGTISGVGAGTYSLMFRVKGGLEEDFKTLFLKVE